MTVVALGFAFLIPLGASASTGEGEFFKEKIKGVEFEIPYEKSEVKVKKNGKGSFGTINVYDRETNELLDTFTVEDEQPLHKYAVNSISAYGTSLKNVSRTRYDNGLGSTLRSRLYMYSSGSFTQINGVSSTQWFASSGSHTLESDTGETVSSTGDFPTTRVNALGDATIQIATSATVSGGWEAAGFSVGGSVSGESYYRKYIELGFSYSVY